MLNNRLTLVVCALSVLLTGCARQISPNVYSESHVGEASHSYRGVVVAMRDVEIEGKEKLQDNALGLIGGGIAGGVLGNQFGGGHGNTAATAAGALAGAIGGTFLQKELEKQSGVEYTVELASGEMRTIVQGPEPRFGVGQRVLLMISYEGRSRIVADNTSVIAPASALAPAKSYRR